MLNLNPGLCLIMAHGKYLLGSLILLIMGYLCIDFGIIIFSNLCMVHKFNNLCIVNATVIQSLLKKKNVYLIISGCEMTICNTITHLGAFGSPRRVKGDYNDGNL
jgi:hypothetical protein